MLEKHYLSIPSVYNNVHKLKNDIWGDRFINNLSEMLVILKNHKGYSYSNLDKEIFDRFFRYLVSICDDENKLFIWRKWSYKYSEIILKKLKGVHNITYLSKGNSVFTIDISLDEKLMVFSQLLTDFNVENPLVFGGSEADIISLLDEILESSLKIPNDSECIFYKSLLDHTDELIEILENNKDFKFIRYEHTLEESIKNGLKRLLWIMDKYLS